MKLFLCEFQKTYSIIEIVYHLIILDFCMLDFVFGFELLVYERVLIYYLLKLFGEFSKN